MQVWNTCEHSDIFQQADRFKILNIIIMPGCQGLPDGPCPQKKNDSTVKLAHCDLYLCAECFSVRFPHLKKPSSQVSAVNNAPKETNAGNDTQVRSSLKDLSAFANDKDSFVSHFVNNLEVIFRYGFKDIQMVLNDFDMSHLLALHKTLCLKFQEGFPQYKEHRPINRQVKNTTIPDIYHLGYSIVNKSPTRDVDKAFVIRELSHSSLNTDEVQELLQAVSSLTKKVHTLQNQVTTLISDNKALHCDLKKVQEELSQCKTTTTPKTVVADHTLATTSVPSPSSRETDSSDSEDPSVEDNSGFVMPSHHKRRLSKRERRERRREQRRQQNVIVSAAVITPQDNSSSREPTGETSTSPATPEPVQEAAPLQAAPSANTSSAYTALSAAPATDNRKVDIYVGGLDAKHGIKDINDHLSKQGLSACSIRILSTQREWRSFVVTVLKSHEAKIMDATLWPNGVNIRHFHPSKSRSSNQNNDQGRHSRSRDDNTLSKPRQNRQNNYNYSHRRDHETNSSSYRRPTSWVHHGNNRTTYRKQPHWEHSRWEDTHPGYSNTRHY